MVVFTVLSLTCQRSSGPTRHKNLNSHFFLFPGNTLYRCISLTVIVSRYGVVKQADSLSFETRVCLNAGSRRSVVLCHCIRSRYEQTLVSTTEDNTLLCGKLFPLRVNSLPLLTACPWEPGGLGNGYNLHVSHSSSQSLSRIT